MPMLQIQELSVSHCLSSEVINSSSAPSQGQPLSFLAIDIYAKLVFSVLKVHMSYWYYSEYCLNERT